MARGHLGHLGTGAMSSWIPLMVFAFLFGLSMDYEVFILARMREEYDATGDTNEAVIRGIGRTGRLVTSAALILFLAFVATGLGAGHRRQGAGHRPGRGHPARRNRRPRAARPGRGLPLRALELGAAAVRGPPAAGRALHAPPPAPTGARRGRLAPAPSAPSGPPRAAPAARGRRGRGSTLRGVISDRPGRIMTPLPWPPTRPSSTSRRSPSSRAMPGWEFTELSGLDLDAYSPPRARTRPRSSA